MGCNCRVTEAVLGIVIIVFAFLNTLAVSKWIIAAAALILLIHSFWCKGCCSECDMPENKKKRKK